MPYQELINRFRSARRDPSVALLEGFHALKHALRFGAALQLVVVSDKADINDLATKLAPDILPRLKGLDVIVLPHEVYRQLAPIAHATGIMALAPRTSHQASAILASKSTQPIVLLDSPQRTNNIGAVIRVAAAAGVAGVLVRGGKDPWSPDAIRAASGLQYAVPVATIDQLPTTSRPIIAIHTDASEPAAHTLPPGAILVFGTEREGIAADLLDRADSRWRLPMQPDVSSLNLATAVAAVVYGAKLAD